MDDMLREAKRIEGYMIQFRRDLHENPELSGEEYRTQGKIMEQLDLLGIPCEKAGTTSLIARLKGNKPGRTIALRADMDALPMEEETEVPFRSGVPGVMHACGHDAHTSMLLGAARILSERRDSIRGEIRFFFQEGEETFTGARKIIEAGGMEGVDACFGMHGMPGLETGFVDISPGYRMAGCDIITVRFEGVSGHGSAPHLARDTIHPACLFVTDLQGIVTKSIDVQEPIVLSVGRFSGGTKANIVAKYTEMDISMRYFDLQARETAHHAIRRHAKGIADAYELKVEVAIEEGPPSLYNDENLTRLADISCKKVFGPGRNQPIKRLMGSEDMPFYFNHAPGIYAFLGYRNEEKEAIYFPHHERFNFDEDALKFGAALFAQFALDFLGGE